MWFQQPGNVTPPLTISNLYRLWDSGVASRQCPRCGTRVLVLDNRRGFGGASFFGFVNYYCQFCREKGNKRVTYGIFTELRRTIRELVEKHPATDPGLPIGDALTKLGELRAADLLDPMHPLETASIKAAGISPPVLTGHHDNAIRRAEALQLVSSPEILESIRKLKAQTEARQAACAAKVEAELAPLRGARGKASPKALFKNGELSLEEYKKILHRKRKLNASISPGKYRCELEESVVRKTRKLLDGRLLTDLEREALLSVLDGMSGEYPVLPGFLELPESVL